jgi:RecJ-like exonuclease
MKTKPAPKRRTGREVEANERHHVLCPSCGGSEQGCADCDWKGEVCAICEDADCNRKVDECAKCGEDKHDNGEGLCGKCDLELTRREERLARAKDAYEADAYDRAGDR